MSLDAPGRRKRPKRKRQEQEESRKKGVEKGKKCMAGEQSMRAKREKKHHRSEGTIESKEKIIPSLSLVAHDAHTLSHTCSGCSSLIACLSETRSHRLGGARPVSLSLTPHASSTRFASVLSSASAALSCFCSSVRVPYLSSAALCGGGGVCVRVCALPDAYNIPCLAASARRPQRWCRAPASPLSSARPGPVRGCGRGGAAARLLRS